MIPWNGWNDLPIVDEFEAKLNQIRLGENKET